MASDLIHEVEQTLYREARLLDERRFHEWLELFTDDVRYWMPVRSTRYPKNSKAITIKDTARYKDYEFATKDEQAYFDDTKETLSNRIVRLDTGMAWAEDPPSRTRHIISNVEVEETGSAKEFRVYSSFLVYRTGLDTEQEFFVGGREDILRRVNGELKIAYRKILLDQGVLLAKNVSIFL